MVVGQNIGPDGIGGVGQSGNDPETLLGVVNEGDDFIGCWQPIELGWAYVQALGGGQRVELTGVKGGEDFLDIDGGNAMDELFFCMEAE